MDLRYLFPSSPSPSRHLTGARMVSLVAARANDNLFVRGLRRLLDSFTACLGFRPCSFARFLYIPLFTFLSPAVFGCSGPQVYLLLASDAPRFLSSSSSQHVPFFPLSLASIISISALHVCVTSTSPHTLRHIGSQPKQSMNFCNCHPSLVCLMSVLE